MKRLISLILLSAFMLLAFAGCGSTDGDKSDTTVTTTSTFNEEEKYSTSIDDSKVSGRIAQIYDPKYEKIWRSEDGKITFTNDNKLGLDGRGAYQGEFENNFNKIEIDVCIDNYLTDDRNDVAPKFDGFCSMGKYIQENNEIVAATFLCGDYVKDDKNKKFILNVTDVDNNIFKSGYKSGDKIVFYQVDE